MSFDELLRRAREGDAAATNTLLDRWRPLLRLQARRHLGAELSARVDPSDVVQESLLQATQGLEQFRGATEAEWVAWLRTIVAGQASMTWRHHQAARRSPVREETRADLGTQEGDPVAALMEDEAAVRLAAAIQSLPPDMSEVVLARAFDRVSFEELAGVLGRSPGATRVLWSRALKRLRSTLGQESSDERC